MTDVFGEFSAASEAPGPLSRGIAINHATLTIAATTVMTKSAKRGRSIYLWMEVKPEKKVITGFIFKSCLNAFDSLRKSYSIEL